LSAVVDIKPANNVVQLVDQLHLSSSGLREGAHLHPNTTLPNNATKNGANQRKLNVPSERDYFYNKKKQKMNILMNAIISFCKHQWTK
jgi:hypothetical protein